MKVVNLMMLCLAILASAMTANAQDKIRLDQPDYAGTGCPAGSVSATLSPDQDAVSILFDSFVAEAGGPTGLRVGRKACSIGIPVHVPQGYSVAIFKVDYRGFNLVPNGGFNRINAEYFWAGVRGPVFTQQYRGPTNADYTMSNGLIATALVWTPCGANVTLRTNASIMSQTNAQMEQSMMTVDSADITSGLIYHLQWRRCQ